MSDVGSVEYTLGSLTAQQIVNHYRNGQIDLEPGFQRDSVWSDSDRSKLINSILRNYPIPSIFLYRDQDNGQLIYRVIDGKQRIESLLRFMGEIRGHRFSAEVEISNDEKAIKLDWKGLIKKQLQYKLMGYRIQTVELTGDFSDIISVFVRINSTGKPLTGAERRNARYFTSDFLRKAKDISRRYEDYFQRMGVMSKSQIARMKHVELVCELMLAAHIGDVTSKKTALDKAMENKALSGAALAKAAQRAVIALKRIRAMFPKLKTTRFSQPVDFYTLAVLIQKFESEGLVLIDSRRNALAWNLLQVFSNGVGEIREKQKKLLPIAAGQEIYRDYFQTTREGTDSNNNRKNRENILRGLLETLFQRKDKARIFSKSQRQILFNRSAEPKCADCDKPLTWENFTIDHIQPHSKGGKTDIDNAALMCRSCNSSHGNRKKVIWQAAA